MAHQGPQLRQVKLQSLGNRGQIALEVMGQPWFQDGVKAGPVFDQDVAMTIFDNTAGRGNHDPADAIVKRQGIVFAVAKDLQTPEPVAQQDKYEHDRGLKNKPAAGGQSGFDGAHNFSTMDLQIAMLCVFFPLIGSTEAVPELK